MKKQTLAAVAAAALALTLSACSGEGYDAESATQAGADYAEGVAAEFGVSDAATICDAWSQDQAEFRQIVLELVEDMDGYSYTWHDEIMEGASSGFSEYCEGLGGY